MRFLTFGAGVLATLCCAVSARQPLTLQRSRPIETHASLLEKAASGSKYEKKKKLGNGQFGHVWLVELKGTGRLYAMKQQDNTPAFKNEFKILKNFCSKKHPFVMRFKESIPCESLLGDRAAAGKKCLVLGLASNGEMGKKADKGASSETLYNWFLQSLAGLSYFHSNGYIHRDIKEANIFLDHKDRVLIGDVGLVIQATPQVQARELFGPIGDPVYTSPEQFQMRQYSYPVDVYALGYTFYKLCTGSYPFRWGGNPMMYAQQVIGSPIPKRSFTYCQGWGGTSGDSVARKVVMSMLKKQQNSRPTAESLLIKFGTTPAKVTCEYLKRCPELGYFGSDAGTEADMADMIKQAQEVIAPPRKGSDPKKAEKKRPAAVATKRTKHQPKVAVDEFKKVITSPTRQAQRTDATRMRDQDRMDQLVKARNFYGVVPQQFRAFQPQQSPAHFGFQPMGVPAMHGGWGMPVHHAPMGMPMQRGFFSFLEESEGSSTGGKKVTNPAPSEDWQFLYDWFAARNAPSAEEQKEDDELEGDLPEDVKATILADLEDAPDRDELPYDWKSELSEDDIAALMNTPLGPDEDEDEAESV
uniref:Protein kinase domain-containing protein n=1 Tax=Chromera velia CCMP2878 TaxID=1169474 RepID=A0A0G4H7M7_9ALVE|eukprot:Cvel_5841.t1-p1 / transcript=Cvel_5841.t1 / gene=Cvel_5841 / organism=Chromera_velia_CCMP2878 / gene_product=Serine/threonine-protein kinase Nek3, putative / transcript_product=Serine/threonine-protein kinase Nek3, putative / location=Cvel_scaffold277:101169-104059(-) / protein_length=584 / sequence_SO=supercontig / SO=protein_coding / is_pseudo=false